MRPLVLLTLTAACGSVSSTPDARVSPLPDSTDAPPQDSRLGCDATAPFGAPVKVGGLADPAITESFSRLSPDELVLYLELGDYPGADLAISQRSSMAEPFAAPVALTSLNSTSYDGSPTVTADGLRVAFDSTRGGSWDIYLASRPSAATPFGAPVAVDTVNAPNAIDFEPYLRPDGQELWFASDRPGGSGGLDLYRAEKTGGDFGAPTRVTELASTFDEQAPVISADGLTLYFAAGGRTGGPGGFDIWEAHRTHTTDPFSAPTVSSVSTTKDELPSWVSPDNCRLYIYSNASGSFDVWVASR